MDAPKARADLVAWSREHDATSSLHHVQQTVQLGWFVPLLTTPKTSAGMRVWGLRTAPFSPNGTKPTL